MSQKNILIIIEDANKVKDLVSKLKESGYQVLVTTSFSISEISEHIKSESALIIIGLNHHNNAGFDLASKIKAAGNIPIIFLAFNNTQDTYHTAKSLNPVAYFTFPVEIENLFSAIELGINNHILQLEVIEAHNKYLLAIKAGKSGVYEIDPSTFQIDGDETLAGLFGYTIQEVKEKGWGNLLPIEDFNKKKSLLADLLNKTIDSYQTETRILRKDGTIAWAQSCGSLVKGIDGKIKIVGTLKDVTESKLVEEQLREYSESLQKSNLAKDKFFSIVSHDLRNPFNSILGFSELLANNIDDLSQEEIKESAKSLHRTSTNLFNLLTNLLEWSRFQMGTFSFDQTEFSISTILNHVCSIFYDSFEAKNIKLVKSDNCDVNVYADQNMIESAIRNLISNAIKFTNFGGTINVGCQSDEKNVNLYVIDDGIGISAADQEKIFKIEQQFSTEGTNYEKGTGFGLLLSKELVEKNNGRISFTSEKGAGSKFIITLPIKK